MHKIDVDLPLVYDPIHLRTWAKLSARVNASIRLYRQSMQEGLIADGHQIQIRSNEVQNNILRDLRLAFFATESSDLENRKRLKGPGSHKKSIRQRSISDVDSEIRWSCLPGSYLNLNLIQIELGLDLNWTMFSL